jgi:hypothetical protein
VPPVAATPVALPTDAVRSLCRALRQIRVETAELAAAGRLSVTADDLLDPAGTVVGWLEELTAAAGVATGASVPLPRREPWALQHVAYTVSAVLVWAEALQADGRLAAWLPDDALAAWGAIEALAGMPGRTAAAMPARPATVPV